MVYIQGLTVQTRIFFYSLGFGFMLGILYDVFRTFRLVISKSKSFAFVSDIVYFLLSSFLTFCFIMVVDSGKVRMYVFFGEILGWLIWYFSFGAIALKFVNTFICRVRSIFSAFYKPLKRIFLKICRKFGKTVSNSKKIMRKNNKKVKFSLQKHSNIVYNLYSYILKRKEKTDERSECQKQKE